jgi:hypothetical protein
MVTYDVHFKVWLRLLITNVAEIILPQILREEISIPGGNSSSTNSNNPPISDDVPSVVPAKINKNQSTHHDTVESNQSRVVAKEDIVSDHNNSSDAFAFVTEMKIQMSQPQNATSPPSVENFSGSSNKQRPGGLGRGGGRGIGRVVHKPSQSKTADSLDSSPNIQNALRSQAMDAASATAVRGSSQNMNNVNTKPRCYAQAVKRAGGAGDGVVTKSPAMSQATPAKATSTSGSPSSSDSQKY